MNKVFKALDQFGVPLTPSISKGQPLFRSVLGGLTTLVIYSACLGYTIYVFLQWHNLELTPKISISQKYQNYTGEQMNYSIMSVAYWKYEESLIDPLKAQGNILTPFIFQQSNGGEFTKYSILNNNKDEVSNYFGGQKVTPQIGIQYQTDPISGAQFTTLDTYLVLALCDPQYMKEGQYCASQSEVDQFFQQKMNSIELTLEQTKYDPESQVAVQKLDELYFSIDKLLCYMHNLKYKTTNYEIRNSLLFAEPNHFNFVDSAENYGQTTSNEFCQQTFGLNAVFSVYIFIDQVSTHTVMDFPNLGDLLANIGSIISVLLMTKYIMMALNAYALEQNIMNQLIDYYYPEFKQLIIKKDWLWRVQQVSLNQKKIDKRAYQSFATKLKDAMMNRMTTANIVYELSRLQFIIQSMVSRENLRKCHGIGIRVKFKELRPEDTQADLMFTPTNETQLIDEDCNILSLENRVQYRSSIKHTNIKLYDFYDMNQIL